jgi:hypothetical protein
MVSNLNRARLAEKFHIQPITVDPARANPVAAAKEHRRVRPVRLREGRLPRRSGHHVDRALARAGAMAGRQSAALLGPVLLRSDRIEIERVGIPIGPCNRNDRS